METPPKTTGSVTSNARSVNMMTAKKEKQSVQAEIAATKARMAKLKKQAEIEKKQAIEAQRKTDELNQIRARRQAEIEEKTKVAAEREQKRQEQAAKN